MFAKESEMHDYDQDAEMYQLLDVPCEGFTDKIKSSNATRQMSDKP